jgi:hypothetical protein
VALRVHSAYAEAKGLVGFTVVLIACGAVGGRCLTVCFDVTHSTRSSPVVSLSGPLMRRSSQSMSLGCREMCSASPDVGFVSVAMGHGDIFFADGLAGGEVGTEVGELFGPLCRAQPGELMITVVITFGHERIRALVSRARQFVAHIHLRPRGATPGPIHFMVMRSSSPPIEDEVTAHCGPKSHVGLSLC